jgi:biopolymer transport protein TolQ
VPLWGISFHGLWDEKIGFMEQVTTAPVSGGPQISLWHLLFQASWPVFIVMIGLGLASLWCWTIIFEKFYAVRKMNAANDKFENQFWSGQSLEDLFNAMSGRQTIGMAAIFVSAMQEWKRSQGAAMRAGFAGVLKRIEKVMDVGIQKEMGGLESRLLFLATVGSAGPFIGLEPSGAS